MLRFPNPVYDQYFADPFVWQAGGNWYAVGTNSTGIPTILRSADLTQWSSLGPALQPLPPEYGDSYWAPEVAFHEGRYFMYYSVGRGDKGHGLRVAISDTPEGPYQDADVTLTNPFRCPFAIDPSPFRDRDGTWYLFYARDFLDTDRPGTALVVDRMESMTTLAGEEHVVARAGHDWQRFMDNRVMYGARYDWHTLEGPCVRERNGKYYCLFSAGRWENQSYGVDWVSASDLIAPWQDETIGDGARLLRTTPGELIGPGHNSLITGPDGHDYIVFHAWDASMTARHMCIQPLEWTPAGPRLV